MNRRGFLIGMFASAAIVKASSLMPVKPPTILLHGDGVTNDSAAFKALINGEKVWDVRARKYLQAEARRVFFPPGNYFVSSEVKCNKPDMEVNLGGSQIDASQMSQDECLFRVNADNLAFRDAKIIGRGPLFPAMLIPVPKGLDFSPPPLHVNLPSNLPVTAAGKIKTFDERDFLEQHRFRNDFRTLGALSRRV